MLSGERIRIIKTILLDKKHSNVADLSAILNVSEVTVRRDLEKLEREKFLTRTHGGALLNDDNTMSYDTENLSDDPWLDMRLEIAQIAAYMIDDSDVILLSPGLTNLMIARKILNKRNITVLTTDLNIASELATNAGINVIIPGGDLHAATMTLTGRLTEENLNRFYVSKAFIEVEGVSLERGFTVQSMEKALVLNKMIAISKERIMVCPWKCFDQIAFSQVGPITVAGKIITNPQIPDSYKQYCFHHDIPLYTTFNTYKGGI